MAPYDPKSEDTAKPSGRRAAPTALISERRLVVLVGAVQFVNVLDFMMVMPLGPDFAKALAIAPSKLGLIGGSYTAAAALAGLGGSLFLDRFDRRRALAVAMLGLVAGTAAGGLAHSLVGLMAARVIAGLFGGPATSLSFSVIADLIPAERRGKAMGAVLGANSLAAVLGVPAGLELAQKGSWRTPFFAVAGLGLFVALGAIFALPPVRLHLVPRRRGDDWLAKGTAWRGTRFDQKRGVPPLPRRASSPGPPLRLRRDSAPTAPLAPRSTNQIHCDEVLVASQRRAAALGQLLGRPIVWLSYSMTAVVMMAGFLILPNLSAFLQYNLGYPRARLGLLYMAGGTVSLGVMRLGGQLVDRYGSFRVGALGALSFGLILYEGVVVQARLPVVVLFIAFMVSLNLRNVAYNTLTSKVPRASERARFLSIQSAVQHFASASGAFASSHLLAERQTGSHALVGMERVASLSIALTALLPLFLLAVESRLQRDDARADEVGEA